MRISEFEEVSAGKWRKLDDPQYIIQETQTSEEELVRMAGKRALKGALKNIHFFCACLILMVTMASLFAGILLVLTTLPSYVKSFPILIVPVVTLLIAIIRFFQIVDLESVQINIGKIIYNTLFIDIYKKY